MPRDFLPGNDQKLNRWFAQFVAALETHHEALGISAAEVAGCDADRAALAAALDDFRQKMNAARAATVAKDGARTQAVAKIRTLARRIQAAPGVDDSLRAEMGLTVPRPRVRRLAPVMPVGLIASVLPDGRILLRWDKGDNKPGVTYLVEGKGGGAAEWQMVGFSTQTKLIPTGDAPGMTLRYRVRALRGSAVSPPSGEVAVWLG